MLLLSPHQYHHLSLSFCPPPSIDTLFSFFPITIITLRRECRVTPSLDHKMQDPEFTMAKSLLNALSGRKASTSANASQTSTKTKGQSDDIAPSQSSRPGRRHRFDDKSGPPPPRGSLTSEKLSYLDCRLKRINNVRQKSEGTSNCWIDGRDTIGRTSFDMARVAVRPAEREPIECIVDAVRAPQAVPMMPSSMAAIYADDKAAALKALQHAYSGDIVLASMPHLAKRDSSSGSQVSGSSDQHASEAPAMLHATADKDVGGVYFTKPRKSLLTRAGSRFSNKRTTQTWANVACATQDSESRPVSRNNRSISRIWNR